MVSERPDLHLVMLAPNKEPHLVKLRPSGQYVLSTTADADGVLLSQETKRELGQRGRTVPMVVSLNVPLGEEVTLLYGRVRPPCDRRRRVLRLARWLTNGGKP